MLTEEEIKVADWIIKTYNTNPRAISHSPDVDNRHVRRIADYLQDEGLLVHTKGAHSGIIHLTPKGEQFQKSGKSYADYLEEKKKKAERDDKHKDLQILDLETKLNVMNQAQLDFWKAQRQKNVQTTIIALISGVLALIALAKTYGYLP